MWRRFWFNRFPGGAFIFLAIIQVWDIPGHLDNAEWWRERLAMFEVNHIAWIICAVGILLLLRPELEWLRRQVVARKAFSADATAVNWQIEANQPAATVTPPSLWSQFKRLIKRSIGAGTTRSTPIRGVAEIERCHRELVKYIRSQPPDPINFEHVALTQEFLPHIERACQILDEQNIPHPGIDADLVFDGMGEWGKFLARLLAVKHDVNKARLLHGEMQRRTDHEGEAS